MPPVKTDFNGSRTPRGFDHRFDARPHTRFGSLVEHV
jgi:hypothetical protein